VTGTGVTYGHPLWVEGSVEPAAPELAARTLDRALLTDSESDEWFGTATGVRGPPRIEESARSTGAGWVLSGNLRSGDILATASGSRLLVIDAFARATETVYNFEVRGTHSYFVSVRALWVHNESRARIDDDGFFAKRHEYSQGRNPGKSRVEISYKGYRNSDFRDANRVAGFKNGKPSKYTWHHVNYTPRRAKEQCSSLGQRPQEKPQRWS
jgi:hypothetical protein